MSTIGTGQRQFLELEALGRDRNELSDHQVRLKTIAQDDAFRIAMMAAVEDGNEKPPALSVNTNPGTEKPLFVRVSNPGIRSSMNFA